MNEGFGPRSSFLQYSNRLDIIIVKTKPIILLNTKGEIKMVINLFCDASIDPNTKNACAGCYVVVQDYAGAHVLDDVTDIDGIMPYHHKCIIQPNATNNSAEILAIWIGVVLALEYRKSYPGAIFRLFSDSKISLYGLREWLKFWVKRMGDDNVLISSSGTPVLNQQRFIDIYNLIVENNLHIELYHQRGHVSDRGMASNIARTEFIKANKCAPEALGLTIDELSFYNATIDALTRTCLKMYVNDNIRTEFVDIEGESPMEFTIRKNMLHQYIGCINKTTIVSRHDFKGGYNQ